MRPIRSAFYSGFVVVACFGLSPAWALDVKAGLWEITIQGIPEVQKACLTRELLDVNLSDLSKLKMPEGVKCTNEIKEQNPKFTVAHTVCTGAFAIEGDSRMDVLSQESMAMKSTSSINLGGQKRTIESSAQYKWISSDCGDVKPVDFSKLGK
jgi:hypothetical protein